MELLISHYVSRLELNLLVSFMDDGWMDGWMDRHSDAHVC